MKSYFFEIIKKQITIVKPKVIIMFGAEVTKILSNTEDSIFHSRGKWYDIYIDISRPVEPSLFWSDKGILTHTSFSGRAMVYPDEEIG